MSEAIMLDIETLGLNPGAPIISIGAVLFSESGIISTFYNASMHWEGSPELGTVKWWLEQERAAQEAILVPKDQPLVDVLRELDGFIGSRPVWGNGSDFDNVHMAHAYKTYGMEWNFRGNRCFRTLKNLYPVDTQLEGTKHNALADALNQTNHLLAIIHKYGVRLG